MRAGRQGGRVWPLIVTGWAAMAVAALGSAAGGTGGQGGATPAPPEGGWAFYRSVDPLDGSEEVTAVLHATRGRSLDGYPIRLVARCRGPMVEASVRWRDALPLGARTEAVPVSIRLGDGAVRRERWRRGAPGETVHPGEGAAHLWDAARTRTLTLAVALRRGGPLVATFDLTGTRGAMGRLRADCARAPGAR